MIEIEFNKIIFEKYWKNINTATDLRTFNVLIPLNYILERMIESLHLYATFVGVIDIQINDDDTITVLYAYNDYNQKQPWFSEDKMNIKLVDFDDEPERIFKIV